MQNGFLLGFIAVYLLGTLALGWWAWKEEDSLKNKYSKVKTT